MARKYRPRWDAGMRWSVEANTDTGHGAGPRRGWVEVYCTATKKQAKADAKKWHAEMGQTVRVKPGCGHPSRRG